VSAHSPAVPEPAEPARRRASETVSGYLAAIAIFASLVGLAWHPLRLILPATLISLIASGMAGQQRRLQFASVVICALCFFLGLTIAVITDHPLY
jgi:phosphoglycerol transferase MdoB-like AlkP superfamily enzyme